MTTVGSLKLVTNQQVDGLGTYDGCVCWLSGSKFLVAHQLQDVSTNGQVYGNPSYLGCRVVNVAGDLTSAAGPFVSTGYVAQDGSESLHRIDATRALYLYRTVDSPTYQAQVVTVAGDEVTFGPQQFLTGTPYARAYALMARDDVLVLYYLVYGASSGLLIESYRVNADAGSLTLLDSGATDVLFTPIGPPYDFTYYGTIQKIADGQVVLATDKTDYAASASQGLLQPLLVGTDGALTTGAAVERDVTSSNFVSGARLVAVTDQEIYVLQYVDFDNGAAYRMPVTYDWTAPSLSLGASTQIAPFNDIWGYVDPAGLAQEVGGQLVLGLAVTRGADQFPRLRTLLLTPVGITDLADPLITAIASPTLADTGHRAVVDQAGGLTTGLIVTTGFESHAADYPVDNDDRIFYDLYVQAYSVGNGSAVFLGSTVRFD